MGVCDSESVSRTSAGAHAQGKFGAIAATGYRIRWWLAAILENFEWPYLRNGSSDRLHV